MLDVVAGIIGASQQLATGAGLGAGAGEGGLSQSPEGQQAARF